MGKRVIGLFISLMMILVLLPITALAADEVTEYPIVVGGVQVNSDNQNDVLNDGTVRFESTGEGQGTLTLNNATITGMYEDQGETYNIGANGIELTINLIGDNKVGDGSAMFAIDSWCGNITIGGDGSLTAQSNWTGIVTVKGGITITGCTITATGGKTGIAATNDEIGNITITDSIVTGIGQTRNGISAGADLSITGSVVTGESGVEGGYNGNGDPVGGINVGGTLTIGEGFFITTPVAGKTKALDNGRTFVMDGDKPAQKAVIEPAYPLWVSGKQVTDAYLSNDTEGWSYDPDAGKLTLTNANITGMLDDYDTFNILAEDMALTVESVGENTVGDGSADFAVYVMRGSLAFSGSDTLNAESSISGIVSVDGNITILDGTINVTGGRTGIVTLGINKDSDITIEGGTVTANGKELHGIAASGTLTITGGTVTGETQISEGETEGNPCGGIAAGNGIILEDNMLIMTPVDGEVGELDSDYGYHYYVLENGNAAQKVVFKPVAY